MKLGEHKIGSAHCRYVLKSSWYFGWNLVGGYEGVIDKVKCDDANDGQNDSHAST